MCGWAKMLTVICMFAMSAVNEDPMPFAIAV